MHILCIKSNKVKRFSTAVYVCARARARVCVNVLCHTSLYLRGILTSLPDRVVLYEGGLSATSI